VSDRQDDPLEYETPSAKQPMEVRSGWFIVGLLCALAFLLGCLFLWSAIRWGVMALRNDWGWVKFKRSDEFDYVIFGLLIGSICIGVSIRWFRHWWAWQNDDDEI
jgi:4-hydroxybenzoate polyprenyltransferase